MPLQTETELRKAVKTGMDKHAAAINAAVGEFKACFQTALLTYEISIERAISAYLAALPEASPAQPESGLLAEAVKVKPLEWAHDGREYFAYCPVTNYRWVARNEAEKRHHDEKRRDLILSALAAPAQPVEAQTQEKVVVANCCHCGRIVDTREKEDGGDDFGAELSDGRWTCSVECWDAVVEPGSAAPQPAVTQAMIDRAEKVMYRFGASWPSTKDYLQELLTAALHGSEKGEA